MAGNPLFKKNKLHKGDVGWNQQQSDKRRQSALRSPAARGEMRGGRVGGSPVKVSARRLGQPGVANQHIVDKQADIQRLRDTLAWNKAAGRLPQDAGQVPPGAPDPNGGFGAGGGGGGFSAAGVDQDYNNQVGQVNQISAEAALRLKQIQDQYAAQAAAAGQGIANDTAQLQGQFGQQVGQLNTDLAAQGFTDPSAAGIGGQAQVQTQALRDAQLRAQTYTNQLAQAQQGNFADRQQSNVLTTSGLQQDLAMQRAGALAGGGGGGGSGGGGGGGGGGYGGSGSSYKDDINFGRQLTTGAKMAGLDAPYYSGQKWIDAQLAGVDKNKNPLIYNTLRKLQAHPGRTGAIGASLPAGAKRAKQIVDYVQKRRSTRRPVTTGRALGAWEAAQSNF